METKRDGSPSNERFQKSEPNLQEIYPQCYAEARKIASQRSQLSLNTFPESPIAPLEKVLDENWLS